MLSWYALLNPKRIREVSTVDRTQSDSRSPFKKDFDTICNSTILRRLQDKAQVFPLEEEDYARSRLTHSIEVLSVAESLGIKAREIIRKKEIGEPNSGMGIRIPEETIDLINDIPTILMSAALLHDMGNPPFGHLGEQIINDWFKENLQHFEYSQKDKKYIRCEQSNSSLHESLKGDYENDLLNFDGNAQLLRLISRLNLVVDENGMNLSFPVIATIIKYPCSSSNVQPSVLSRKKAGYFSSEKDIFRKVMKTLDLAKDNGYCRHPLAFLLEAADDIAYLTADIEDAHHKGIIKLEDIDAYMQKYGRYDAIVNNVLKEIEKYRQAADRLGYPNADDYVMKRLRIYLKGQMINSMSQAFESQYPSIMQGECEDELLEKSDANILSSCLRTIEKEKIHYCSSIVENKTKAIAVINKLLDRFVPAVINYSPNTDYRRDTEQNLIYLSFSENYRFLCERANVRSNDEKTILYNKLRLVIDQISGMTDTRAMSVYKVLTAV